MKPSSAVKIGLLSGVAIAVCAVTAAFAIFHSDDFDSRVQFSLIDQTGTPVSEQTYHGQYLLVFFGFTHCPKICPTQMTKLTQVVGRLDRELSRETVTPIFITVDPGRDSAERIQSYLSYFHPRFVGLRGSPDALARAARRFSAIGAQPSSVTDDDVARHSSVAYLVDPTGRVVTHIAADATVDEAAQRINEYLL